MPAINIAFNAPSATDIRDALLNRTPVPAPQPTVEVSPFSYMGRGLSWDEATHLVETYVQGINPAVVDVAVDTILKWAQKEHAGALDGFKVLANKLYLPSNTPTPPYVTPTVVVVPAATPMPTNVSVIPHAIPIATPTSTAVPRIQKLDFGEEVLYAYGDQALTEGEAYGTVWHYLESSSYAEPDDTKVKAVLNWARHTNGNCWDTSKVNPMVCGDLNGFKSYCSQLWGYLLPPTATPMPKDAFEEKYGFAKADLPNSRWAQILKIEPMGGDWFVRVHTEGDRFTTYYIRVEYQRPNANVWAGDVVYKHDDGLWDLP